VHVVSGSGLFPVLYGNRGVVHKTGSTYRIALPSEKDQATATGNMCTVKFGKIWTCDFGHMQADRQTNKQTNTQTR